MSAPVPLKKFGTFTGVFTPTLLTILGVIMYVRLGWMVGNAGLFGAFAIMALALGITACTGLSLSSIATNTRLGAGGPYAIIAKSLGFEVGGSIGLPLYLSRPLGVAMYIFGFREGWHWIFPEHPALLVDLLVFGVLFGVSFKSADLAFRVQYLIMAVIAGSLLSIVGSVFVAEPIADPVYVGSYPGFPEEGFAGVDFWGVFAVFFPATTGILAGANMSGDLKDPRRAIPIGTLAAILLSTVIYFGLAWWGAMYIPEDELASNYNAFIDNSVFPPLVLAGLLGATASSALAGLVGGPRILMAMGQHRILPQSAWLAQTRADGEPRNAMVLTGVLTLACLMMRDLNAIAPLVTMFFLITYGVINLVVLIEGSLDLVSFRPTLRVPLLVPFLGVLGSVFAMFIVNPTFGLIAVMLVLATYVYVQRRGVTATGEDVRSSIFVAMAEWAAARVNAITERHPRAWKPNLLVPVDDPEQLRGEFHFLLDVVRPEGSIKLLGLSAGAERRDFSGRLERLGRSFHKKGVLCTWSVVDFEGFGTAVWASLQALQGAFFRPNILCLTLPDRQDRFEETHELLLKAQGTGVGVLMVALHPKAGLGQRNIVNVWVRAHPQSWDPHKAFEAGSLNLILLMAYRLMRTWNAEVNLFTVVPTADQEEPARRFLDELCDLTRFPNEARREVRVGAFEQVLSTVPVADVNVMGIQPEPNFAFTKRMVHASRSTCLFVLDSGRESALA